MPLCPRCGSRIAKRSCPALGSRLCNLCCGRLREKELHCPPACPHLARHQPYQEKRVLERVPARPPRWPQAENDVLKDERLAWLVLQLEAPLAQISERSPSMTDGQALLALEYARAKVDKGRGLLIIPGESRKPSNELGEALFTASERARWEAPVLLTSGLESYGREEKLRCLDRIIFSVRLRARGAPEGRAYLNDLVDRFARIRGLPQKSRIVP
jgi:hypothetical protein